MNTLSVKELAKKHNQQPFLQNISFEIAQGDCLGILGANGSGKSTLLSIVAGTAKPSAGQILLNSGQISQSDRKKIGYIPQAPVLTQSITVRDNLKLWQAIYNLPNSQSIPSFLGIEQMLGKKVQKLSGGMQKKVSIAIALMNNPDFLIMDEAFAALDSQTCDLLIDYIKSKQMGVLYSSHNITEIIKLCNKVLVLRNGNISYQQNRPIDPHQVTQIYEKF